MSEENNSLIKYVHDIGAVFRLGSGVLGKSAIAVGILIVVGGIAIWRLHSDAAILSTFGLLAIIFFLWFFPVMHFVRKHPDAALLEGAEWTGFQRFQASAKGFIPPEPQKEPSLLPGSEALLPGESQHLIDSGDEEPNQ